MMVVHKVAMLDMLADKVVVMEKGRVAEYGEPKALLAEDSLFAQAVRNDKALHGSVRFKAVVVNLTITNIIQACRLYNENRNSYVFSRNFLPLPLKLN